MNEEITDHLGYKHGDPAGHGSGNSRNGKFRKTVSTQKYGQAPTVHSRWFRCNSRNAPPWRRLSDRPREGSCRLETLGNGEESNIGRTTYRATYNSDNWSDRLQGLIAGPRRAS